MENENLIRKRYVNGLRNASIVLSLILVMALVTSIFLPLESKLAQQLFILVNFISLAIFAIIAVAVNDKNYNFLLAIVLISFVAYAFSREYIENEIANIISKPYYWIGGRLIDYMFIWTTTPMIIPKINLNILQPCYL